MAKVRHQIHRKSRDSFHVKREPSPSTVRLTAGSTSLHYSGVLLENNIILFTSGILPNAQIRVGCFGKGNEIRIFEWSVGAKQPGGLFRKR